jgi:hypothetical protein
VNSQLHGKAPGSNKSQPKQERSQKNIAARKNFCAVNHPRVVQMGQQEKTSQNQSSKGIYLVIGRPEWPWIRTLALGQ